MEKDQKQSDNTFSQGNLGGITTGDSAMRSQAPPPVQLTAGRALGQGGPLQMRRHNVYASGDGNHFVWDDQTGEVLRVPPAGGNGVVIGQAGNMAEAQEVVSKNFLAAGPAYPAQSFSQGAGQALEGQIEAQMWDADAAGNAFEEDGIVFDGAVETAEINLGESVSSMGANTCVIVILVATRGARTIAACRHFTAGTDHFEAPNAFLNDMVDALNARLGAGNAQNPGLTYGEIEAYAVGGVNDEDDPNHDDCLRLREHLQYFNVRVFAAPVNGEGQAASAMYGPAGFAWNQIDTGNLSESDTGNLSESDDGDRMSE